MKFNTPIVITGSPHSGKSLLAKILGQDQSFYCFGEAISVWNYGINSSGSDVRSELDASPEVVEVIRNNIKNILLREKKKRYIDEFAYHALRVPFVKKVLPEAKIIMLVRDPADVIPEMIYFWKYRDPLYEAWKRHRKTISLGTLPSLAKKFLINYVAVRLRGRRQSWGPMAPGVKDSLSKDLAETVTQQWASLVRIGMDDLESYMGERSMVVKFEDMVLDPQGVITKVAKFCEMDSYEEVSRFAVGLLDPSYRFEKREKVDAETSLKLDQQICELRDRLGYKFRESWL